MLVNSHLPSAEANKGNQVTTSYFVKASAVVSFAMFTSLCAARSAVVKVDGAWVRATVQGQKGTGAFMSITATEGARLVSVSSSAAGVAEVHEMKTENDIMKMRAVPFVDLPAGRAVEFKPGGYHIMLMDLKQPLPVGSKLPLTLVFKDAKGVQSKLELTLPVSGVAPKR